MIGSFGTVLTDYRAPDVMRFTTLSASTVLTGSTAYEIVSGAWTRVDPAEAVFLHDLVLSPRIMSQWARLNGSIYVKTVAHAAGPVRIFRYASFDKHTQLYTTVGISENDNLPRFAQFDTPDTHTTIDYSDYGVATPFPTPPR